MQIGGHFYLNEQQYLRFKNRCPLTQMDKSEAEEKIILFLSQHLHFIFIFRLNDSIMRNV